MAKCEPLISVLLPVYNAEEYVSRCLDSILSQTYKNLEIVAIDDGSTDESAHILDVYAQNHPSLFVVEHRKNGGVASARNRAIELANGDYITFIDNDDYFDNDYIDSLLTSALQEDADIVCTGFNRPDTSGKIVTSATPTPNTEWGPFVVEAAWAKLYRTSFVRSRNLQFLPANIGEDLFFTLPAIVSTTKIAIIRRNGYNWFYNTRSVSSTAHRSSQGLQFEYSLNSLYSELNKRKKVSTEIVERYFIKYIAWFLLYTCRGDAAKECAVNYQRYTKWLDKHFPNWRRNGLSTPFRPTGETQFNRVAVWLFAKHPLLFRTCLKGYRALGASK